MTMDDLQQMVLATDGEHFIDGNDSETNEDEFHR